MNSSSRRAPVGARSGLQHSPSNGTGRTAAPRDEVAKQARLITTPVMSPPLTTKGQALSLGKA